MAGTLDRLLLRKRAYKNASSQVTLGEQFWLAKYDPATKLFTDLGLNDSDGSYVENITGHDNFDFSATESVGIGNSLGKVLTDNFPSIQMQAAAISYAVSGNMLNPLATTDLPPHMSTLATGWTL